MSFSQLNALRQLNLSNNRFSNVPNSILKLANLQILDLSNNQITEISGQIETIQVDELNLNNNRVNQ